MITEAPKQVSQEGDMTREGLLVITRDQLNVGEIIKAKCAGVLLDTQPLHGLQLEGPRQDFLLLL